MLQYLNEHPTTYLDELVWWLLDTHSIAVHPSTVYRALQRRRWSRTVAQKEAAERDALLRAVWRARAVTWDVNRVVCVDESASNERTGYRKYGWSAIGVECHDIQSLHRSPRWSVLPAITINGFLDGTLVYQGSITAAIFEEWMEGTVIPQLAPRSIIVMDNASIHRSERIRTMVIDAGHRIEYLPPYSPDFNPIEMSFATLKAYIRRHIAIAATFEDFGAYIAYCVAMEGGRSARGQFKHSGFTVEDY